MFNCKYARMTLNLREVAVLIGISCLYNFTICVPMLLHHIDAIILMHQSEIRHSVEG